MYEKSKGAGLLFQKLPLCFHFLSSYLLDGAWYHSHKEFVNSSRKLIKDIWYGAGLLMSHERRTAFYSSLFSENAKMKSIGMLLKRKAQKEIKKKIEKNNT